MSCAKAAIIKATAPQTPCVWYRAINAKRHGLKAAVWGSPVRDYALSRPSISLAFAALGFIALGQHFGQDIPRAVRIAHVDIGLGQVQLGCDLIGAGQEVDLRFVTTQRRVFGGEGRLDRRVFQALGQAIELGVDVIQFRRKRIGFGRRGVRLVGQGQVEVFRQVEVVQGSRVRVGGSTGGTSFI